MDQQLPYIPNFGLNEGDRVEYTPPHNYSRIIIPTQSFDVIFNQQLADLMEWSIQNPDERNNLMYFIQEAYQQMGDCYDHSHVRFIHMLQGNPGEIGVPGYPAFGNLSHFDMRGKEVEFVTIFRHAALTFFAIVNPYAQYFPNMDFVYHKYITGGWIFYLSPRKVNYDI